MSSSLMHIMSVRSLLHHKEKTITHPRGEKMDCRLLWAECEAFLSATVCKNLVLSGVNVL